MNYVTVFAAEVDHPDLRPKKIVGPRTDSYKRTDIAHHLFVGDMVKFTFGTKTAWDGIVVEEYGSHVLVLYGNTRHMIPLDNITHLNGLPVRQA